MRRVLVVEDAPESRVAAPTSAPRTRRRIAAPLWTAPDEARHHALRGTLRHRTDLLLRVELQEVIWREGGGAA